MSRRLWWAHLSKSSPRYQLWREILDSDDVPLQRPVAEPALLGEDAKQPTEIYRLDLSKFTTAQLDRLVAQMAKKFDLSESEASAELASNGFPIRAEDVFAAFDLRAFL